MHTIKPTPSPARRAVNNHPPLRHLLHHQEPDGTIHYMCGIVRAPGAATIGPHRDKTPCAACDAAAHLLEVMP